MEAFFACGTWFLQPSAWIALDLINLPACLLQADIKVKREEDMVIIG